MSFQLKCNIPALQAFRWSDEVLLCGRAQPAQGLPH